MKNCSLIAKSKVVSAYIRFIFGIRAKIYIKGVPQLLLVVALILPCVYFSNKYIEAVFQIIALLFLRYKFPKTYHCGTMLKCTFLTLSIAYLAIPNIPSIGISLLASISISFAIAFLSWLAQEFIDNRKKLVKLSCYDIEVLTDRQKAVYDALRRGIVGEKQIDYILSLGFDYSGSTQDREYKEIKRKLGLKSLKF